MENIFDTINKTNTMYEQVPFVRTSKEPNTTISDMEKVIDEALEAKKKINQMTEEIMQQTIYTKEDAEGQRMPDEVFFIPASISIVTTDIDRLIKECDELYIKNSEEFNKLAKKSKFYKSSLTAGIPIARKIVFHKILGIYEYIEEHKLKNTNDISEEDSKLYEECTSFINTSMKRANTTITKSADAYVHGKRKNSDSIFGIIEDIILEKRTRISDLSISMRIFIFSYFVEKELPGFLKKDKEYTSFYLYLLGRSIYSSDRKELDKELEKIYIPGNYVDEMTNIILFTGSNAVCLNENYKATTTQYEIIRDVACSLNHTSYIYDCDGKDKSLIRKDVQRIMRSITNNYLDSKSQDKAAVKKFWENNFKIKKAEVISAFAIKNVIKHCEDSENFFLNAADIKELTEIEISKRKSEKEEKDLKIKELSKLNEKKDAEIEQLKKQIKKMNDALRKNEHESNKKIKEIKNTAEEDNVKLKKQLEFSRNNEMKLIKMQRENPDTDKELTNEMINVLQRSTGLFTGGTPKFQEYFKKYLPNWTFVLSESETIGCKKIDAVVNYTVFTGHSLYYKAGQVAEKMEVPYIFLNGSNQKYGLIKIYEEISKTKDGE